MGFFRKAFAYSFLLFFCLNVFAKDVKSPPKTTSKTVTSSKQTKPPVKKVAPKPAAKPAVKPTTQKKPAPKPTTSSKQTKPPVKKVAPKPAVKPAAKPTTQKKPPSKPTTSSTQAKAPVKKVVSKQSVKPTPKPTTKTSSSSSTSKAVVKKTTSIKSVKKQSYNNDRLIILDAGHGGYDLGCRLSSCNEKSLALSTTLMIKKMLTDMGYRVILTRSRDIFIPLKKRIEIANETKSKLFISIHYNAAKNTDAKGIEVFYYKSKDKWRSGSSKKLAVRVLSKLIDRTGAKNRGVKDGNFCVIRETKMPAILVEGGFITHEDERNLLKDSSYRAKIAKGVAEGIDSYFKA